MLERFSMGENSMQVLMEFPVLELTEIICRPFFSVMLSEVFVPVQGPSKLDDSVVLEYRLSGVAVGVLPVGGTLVRGAIGEPELNPKLPGGNQLRVDLHGYHIPGGVYAGAHRRRGRAPDKRW